MYEGNSKLILGLIWTLILYYQISTHGITSTLLAWINAQIPDQNITNFTTDWNDGVALCALVGSIRPELQSSYTTLDREKKLENCSLGTKLAQEELGVAKMIEPEDLCDGNVDKQSVMTYISSFCRPANYRLLKWVQSILPDRNITNLSTDWQNGVNLACLLDALAPGLMNPEKVPDDLIKAMEVGEKHFGLNSVLTDSQRASGQVDEITVATYLTHLQRKAIAVPCDADTTRYRGHGLTKAFLGRPATFEIDASHTQRLRVTAGGEVVPAITIVGTKNDTVQHQLEQNGKGQFQVKYTPWSTGKLKIEIKWKSVVIPDRQFSSDVIDMKTVNFTLRERCIKIGNPIIFKVEGVSDFGDDDVDILLQDSKGGTDLDTKVDKIILKSEGIIECPLRTAQPGKYNVVTKLAGVRVTGSPFKIEIADPQLYTVQMSETAGDASRLTINQLATFSITAKDANCGSLVAKIQKPGASEPKVLTLSQHSGSIGGKFTPTDGGIYEVRVTCVGENILGSPIKLTATDPHRCFFDNELPRFLQVGVPCKINLSTRGAGPGEVEVSSSSSDRLKVNGERQSEDYYTIQLTPIKIGESTIDVKFDGVSLPPTPHVLSICDARKCKASGEVIDTGRAKCNEQFGIKVDSKEAGKGDLTVKLNHGPRTISCSPECDGQGNFDFTLASYEPGMHLLNILWGGVHIPNSPFTVKVSCGATLFKAQGDGLKEATTYKPAKFVVKGPQSGLLDEKMLHVKIRDAWFESKMVSKDYFNPSNEEALVCVTEDQKGTYSVEYSVPSHGNFTIYVTVDDKAIPESPFNVKVSPASDPSRCKAFGDAIQNPHNIILSKSIEFMVDTTEAGIGEITALATDPRSSNSRVSITELKSGETKKIYQLKVDPKVTGEHKIDVHWNEAPIPGSPFSFSICDPSKVKILHLPNALRYTAEVEKPLTFRVDTEEAGGGELQCTVKVTSAKTDEMQEITVEPKLQDDGKYALEFAPHEIGQMQLHLVYNSVSILPGPWACEIVNPQLSLLSSNSHEKQNQPVSFKVEGLVKRMANRLKISINHRRHKNPKYQTETQDKESITYNFLPEHVGQYVVSVKFNGKDIRGSPISVKVVNPKACTIKGVAPSTVFMQREKQFVIDTSRAGPGELSCEIMNDDQEKSSPPKLDYKIISATPENTTVELCGLLSGKCQVLLKWSGFYVSDTPLDIVVYDPSQVSYRREQVANGIVPIGDEVFVFIDTSKAGPGGCEPLVLANGPSKEYPVGLEKICEREYMASFTPQEEGSQTVQILAGDVMIPECPFTLKAYAPVDVANDPEDADKASVQVRKRISDQSDHSKTDEYDSPSPGVTFTVGVETSDNDRSKVHLRVVNPKRRYRVNVEEKCGKWQTSCTALDEVEQELQVFFGESEQIGHPIKISVGDQTMSSGWGCFKAFLAALLVFFMLSMLAVMFLLSMKINDPDVRPT